MNDLKRQFQTLLLIATFMPVVLLALGVAGDTILSWGTVIATLLTVYVAIEIELAPITKRLQRLAAGCIIANILSYISLLLILAVFKDGTIEWPITWVLAASVWSVFWLPFVLLAFTFALPILIDAYNLVRQLISYEVFRRAWEKLKPF